MSASKGKPVAPVNKKPQTSINNQTVQPPKPWAAQDYVNHNTSLEEVKQIKKAFDIFDSNGSGLVDPLELKNAFVSLGFGKINQFVYNIINDLDTTNVGGLNFEAFLKLATGKIGETHSRQEIQSIFKSFDHHKNGKINAQDFKEIAQKIGENLTDQEVDRIFQKTDYDQDGYITAEDFYSVIAQREGTYE